MHLNQIAFATGTFNCVLILKLPCIHKAKYFLVHLFKRKIHIYLSIKIVVFILMLNE